MNIHAGNDADNCGAPRILKNFKGLQLSSPFSLFLSLSRFFGQLAPPCALGADARNSVVNSTTIGDWKTRLQSLRGTGGGNEWVERARDSRGGLRGRNIKRASERASSGNKDATAGARSRFVLILTNFVT